MVLRAKFHVLLSLLSVLKIAILMLACQCPSTQLKISLPETETTVNLNPNMTGWSNCQYRCMLSLRLMLRAFYKGNRISWMEDILPRDTVNIWLVEFFSNTKPLKCAVYGQKTTGTSRRYFILFTELIRYVSFSSQDSRALSEYLEGLEDSPLI